MATTMRTPMLLVGTPVDVFSRFHSGWVTGFEITAIESGRYALRRHTDAAVLPSTFDPEDVRASRPRTA